MLFRCQRCNRARSLPPTSDYQPWHNCPVCHGMMEPLSLEQVLAEAKEPPAEESDDDAA